MSTIMAMAAGVFLAFPFFEEAESEGNHEYMVVLAEALPDTLADGVYSGFQDLVADTAAVDDLVTVILSPDYVPLLTLKIPFGSKDGRLKNAEVVAALDELDWQLGKESADEEVTNSNEEDKELERSQLNIPVLSVAVREHRRGAALNLPIRIIIAGDSVYHDPAELGWSMRGSHVIEDGAVDSVFATCPYGKSEKFPKNTTVSIVTKGTVYGDNLEHSRAMTRFHGVFFEAKDASMRYCGPNADVAFTQFTNSFEEDAFVKDPRAGKTVRLVSVGSERAPVPAKEIEPIVIPVIPPRRVSFFNAPSVNVDELIADAEAHPEKLLIAIHWESEATDIDLWIRNNRFPAEELSWNDMLTSFGSLHRDVRRSQGGASAIEHWEVASLNCPPEDVTLWLNCYTGPSGPKKITIIKVWQGKKKEGVVVMDAAGDEADGYLKRRESASWRKVRVVPRLR